MIDLDKIESAARKPWYCRSKQEDNLLSPEVLVDLITSLRQAEKDAARYRWLRECNWNLSVACVVVDPKKSVKLGCDCPSGDRLDELVDAHL